MQTQKGTQLLYYLQDQWIMLRYFFMDGEMIYFIFFTLSAILSLINKFFISFLLFDVFWRFPTLATVLLSIWRPKKQIILTLFLFMIIQYMYALIMFTYYSNEYVVDGIRYCGTFKQCFIFVFDITFKVDG